MHSGPKAGALFVDFLDDLRLVLAVAIAFPFPPSALGGEFNSAMLTYISKGIPRTNPSHPTRSGAVLKSFPVVQCGIGRVPLRRPRADGTQEAPHTRKSGCCGSTDARNGRGETRNPQAVSAARDRPSPRVRRGSPSSTWRGRVHRAYPGQAGHGAAAWFDFPRPLVRR